MKKKYLTLLLTLTSLIFGYGQKKYISCLQPDLKYGKYEVGFKSYNNYDYSRTFGNNIDDSNKGYRPIQTSIWYPAIKKESDKYLKDIDFLYLIGLETEFKEQSDSIIKQIIEEFIKNNVKSKWGISRDSTVNELNVISKSIKDASFINKKFPVIIYATGSNGPSYQNATLFEYLASYGYVVISSPNVGFSSRYIKHYRNDFKEIETQARDIEYLISFANDLSNTDMDKIGLIGYSFGGTSTVLAANRNIRIKALVSFDGSIRFNYPIHKMQSDLFDAKRLKIPYLYLAEKTWPIDTLKKYDIPDIGFTFFSELENKNAYHFELLNTVHENFNPWSTKYSHRIPEWGEGTIQQINNGYNAICDYTLNFFDFYLKNDSDGFIYLNNEPEKNGVESETIKRINH